MKARSYTRYGKYVTKKTKKQRRLQRPLYRENARQRGMLSRRLRKRKKKSTRHNTKKQPTNPPKACTRPLSTGGKKRGGMNREVCILHYAYHAFCYTSTGPLLLLFFCFLTTTMLTDDKNQPRYDTPHKPQTARTHTHTHANHTAHDPRTPPTPTPSATQQTHTHHDQGEGHPGHPPPQPQVPNQEWRGTTPTALGQESRGTNHGTLWRTRARSGGAP